MTKPTPATPSAEVLAMSDQWGMISALLGGTKAMRDAGKVYLPKFPAELDASYNARLSVATLLPAFKRTVEVLASKPFVEPIALGDDIPSEIKSWLENIDLQGRTLDGFAADVFEQSLGYGMSGILVAYPPTEKRRVRTKAQEKSAGLRPYLLHIRPQNLLGWKSTSANGVEVLTQLRLLECVTVDVSEFEETQINQVRILYPDRFEVWRQNEKGNWIIFDSGKNTLGKIPFVPFYAKRIGFMKSEPPLVDLAYMNIKHWQSDSDQQTILHVARVPILFGSGFQSNTSIAVGAGVAVTNDEPNAKLMYVEHSGAAISAGRDYGLDMQENMRQIGAELLVLREVKATATEIHSDSDHSTCALKKMAEDFEGALDNALQLMAEWVGQSTGGHVNIFKDFGVSSLAEASMELLRELSMDGLLSKATLFAEAKRRGMIAPELEYEDEQKLVKKFGNVERALTDKPAVVPN